MKGYTSDAIRNVALIGHGGCGKTTLLEALLFDTGVISRMGRVEEKNTVSDYDKMEMEKGYSINATVVSAEYNDTMINFVDTPGYFDFIGEVKSALRAVESAIVVVDASAGIQVGTVKAWKAVHSDMPAFFLINKMDKENVDFESTLSSLREKFGKIVTPFMLPIMEGEELKGYVNVVDRKAYKFTGKGSESIEVPQDKEEMMEEYRQMLIESVAESDEELLNKFFEGVEFTDEEILKGLRAGINAGTLAPVMVCSATKVVGIKALLEMICDYFPTPKDHKEYAGLNENDETEVRACSSDEPSSAFIFKTLVDPFVGKISMIKVISGSIKAGSEYYNMHTEKNEKIGKLFFMRGKAQFDASAAEAGDIAAIAKLQYAKTGDTLCDKAAPIRFPEIFFPEPSLQMAIVPKAKGDEEKIGTGLNKLMEEDPSFEVIRNPETHQMLVGGQGEIQIGIIIAKLKEKFGVDIEIESQKIPYRETIKGNSDVQGKHKKQSGGAGQYGDVHIRFSPSTEEFEFSEELFGGSVPKSYVPAVEKGLRECMSKGPLAGYPVVNVKAVLYDGSYHDVDSNEMAFKIAASLAFKKGIAEAKPILLEPIMHVEILVPDEFMGDVMGDLNKRRGKILGMEPLSDEQKLMAEVPMAEMLTYAITLRSMTQARASFRMCFERYEEVPMHLSQKIIDEAKQSGE
ncbi:elongation factor G [Sinanaerobacter sp. ZZT-01]|uniref:elongation factor G n=1 Tax=Sinanaerobacter sp. ZZT-01 TaxID=3111540 RepID=UPI002D766A70|nr:elongation factor G [Sinanaerobacter sp. ZZT-01]WRR95011.1 elongation factor G [Sinanaerobacter sp. ZZT-01]